jgi:hypothetical protein
VEVAKHCDAVHGAGAGAALVRVVARWAARVNLEENIASKCDVPEWYGWCRCERWCCGVTGWATPAAQRGRRCGGLGGVSVKTVLGQSTGAHADTSAVIAMLIRCQAHFNI